MLWIPNLIVLLKFFLRAIRLSTFFIYMLLSERNRRELYVSLINNSIPKIYEMNDVNTIHRNELFGTIR